MLPASHSLAWCVTTPLTGKRKDSEFCKLVTSPRRVTRRRPRARFTCQTSVSSKSTSPSEDEKDSSTNFETPPPAAPVPQMGVLTDSVLEVKWKNEKRRVRDAEEVVPCICDDNENSTQTITDEVMASDPYKAFSKFTRLAAPTAALGRDDYDAPTLSTVPDTLRSPDFRYSAASIAYRLMRYSYAKKNMADFLQFFQGEFDNYDQIAEERRAGMLPRDGGGHEHIHCSVTQVAPDLLFARYYFNGDPSYVFRSRLYRLHFSDECERGIVEMRIFRFYEETERRLKAKNYDVNAIEWTDDDIYDWLEGCEVFWERYEPETPEDDEASQRLGIEPGPRFVGYMEGGGCELYSRELGGRIRVLDDLLLTSEDLWVADRGFDEHDNFVYGNRRGVPYKMKRVRPNSHTAWTLSASEPAPDGYVP